MADQEEQSPTVKTPRITHDQLQENTSTKTLPDSALDATRKAPAVNPATLSARLATSSEHVPPVVAQPVPWWLQASPPVNETLPAPAAREIAEAEQAGSDLAAMPDSAVDAEVDDAATGPVPAVALAPEPDPLHNVDRFASSFEEYATNAFAALDVAPTVMQPEIVAPPPAPASLPSEQDTARAVEEAGTVAHLAPAPEITANTAADDIAAQFPPAPAEVTPPPAWVQALQHADDNVQPEPVIPAEPDLEESAMPQMQWEYCRVQLDSGSYTKSQNVGRYPYYVRVAVDYYGAEVPPTVTFSEDTDALDRPHKIWGQILGQLGLANWEMINIYTGTAKDYALVNVMAYFKRTVQSDRRVAEPKLTV